MIDTHAHLDFSDFAKDRGEVINSCHNHDVKFIINIGVDLLTSKASIGLAEKYDFIYATVGYHPHDAKDLTESNFDEIKKLAAHAKVVAIGEIGLDYYRDKSPRPVQQEALIRQLDLADELHLPVVLHIREAIPDTFAILRKRSHHNGVLHAFPGDLKACVEAIEMGYYIAFGGPVTYPKSNRAEIAAALPSSRILTETDCPYLTPQQFRGKRNQPDYIKYVIKRLAESMPRYTYADIERITELNAARLFNLPLDDAAQIAYKIGDSLYLNTTSRCTNNCYFCPKNSGCHVAGHNLRLKHEPSEQEIIEAVKSYNGYNEIVFCGLGEPTLRADLMLSITAKLKTPGVQIRLDTNGQGSLITKTDLPKRMSGIIDSVNVSLNAQNAEVYNQICHPQYPDRAYAEMLKFAGRCKAENIKTVFSVVDIPEIDIGECQKIADKVKIPLRIRKYAAI